MTRRAAVVAETIREIWRDLLWLYTALKPYRRPRSRGRISRALETVDRARNWEDPS